MTSRNASISGELTIFLNRMRPFCHHTETAMLLITQAVGHSRECRDHASPCRILPIKPFENLTHRGFVASFVNLTGRRGRRGRFGES